MNEKRVIEEFMASVSWADSGYIRSWNKHIFLILDNPELLFLPCHWQQFESLQHEVLRLAIVFKKKPNLLIWGNPDAVTIEKIMRQCGEAVAWFVEPEAELIRNQLLTQLMDGIDLGRTLLEILSKGEDAQPVLEWD